MPAAESYAKQAYCYCWRKGVEKSGTVASGVKLAWLSHAFTRLAYIKRTRTWPGLSALAAALPTATSAWRVAAALAVHHAGNKQRGAS